MTDSNPASMPQRLMRAVARLDARLPLVLKLTLPIVMAAAVVFVFLGTALYRTEANGIRDSFEKRALLLTNGVEAAVANATTTEDDADLARRLQTHIDFLTEGIPTILLINVYAIRDGGPTIIASSGLGRAGAEGEADIEEDLEAIYATSARVDEEDLNGESALEVSLPIRIDGKPALALGAYFSTAQRDHDLGMLLRNVILGGGVALLLVSAAVFLVYRFLIFPRIRLLLTATERIQEGDYGARVAGVPPADARDEMVRLSAYFNSMAEAIESLQGCLREQATTDELTGLYNRRYVIEALNREIHGTRRHQRKVAIAIFDLDGLKGINDRFGHTAGDDALSKVAAVIGGAVRASEVAARFGGDEFVVLLPDSDSDALRSVMNRIRVEVEELGAVPADANRQLRLTVSAGGALMQDGDTADTLFDRADMAMYEAKRAGRNQVQIAA